MNSMEKLQAKFGRAIKEIRAKKEWDLKELCMYIGFSDISKWSKIERGLAYPTINASQLHRLFNYADVSIENMRKLLISLEEDCKEPPPNISENEFLLSHLPAFPSTLDQRKPSSEELDGIMQLQKEAYKKVVNELREDYEKLNPSTSD